LFKESHSSLYVLFIFLAYVSFLTLAPHRLTLLSLLFIPFFLLLPYLNLLILSIMTDDYSVSPTRNIAPTLQRGKACLRCRYLSPPLPLFLVVHLSDVSFPFCRKRKMVILSRLGFFSYSYSLSPFTPPTLSVATAPNRLVNNAFVPKSKTYASTTMARARREPNSSVKLSPISRPVLRNSRVQSIPHLLYPSLTHTRLPSLRTLPLLEPSLPQVSLSLHLNPPIPSVRVCLPE
jgi:hypothetical protein